MLRDFKFMRRKSGKDEEMENVPVNPRDSLLSQASTDSSSRAPLNTIQEPVTNPKKEPEVSFRGKIERTPTKPKAKNPDYSFPLRTPDRCGPGFSSKSRWAQKNDSSSNPNESRDESYSIHVSRGVGNANGGLVSMTPRTTTRAVGRATPSYTESNSTQSTPTKSVTKPPSSLRSKIDGNGGLRVGTFATLYKGMPSSCGAATIVNTVEVPHFDLKEDPSFWMDHNVQVLIRVRPLNSMEKSMHGYNRCLKQESGQSITWIGQPETRFIFDHVACETANQEMVFRMAGLPMVENCLSGYNSCMFAYGQTGSGKTHTMLGEIEDLEVKPSPNRGMTPRIFEFLFARIQAEEESRIDEKLKYNCKCSFLEIYNEQITDLLDPTSTNLLLREDVKKGVYVENLSEYEVLSVHDILKLLTQGSLNRKVAATNMNRESSRSHSVFTCVIESRWEKDSTTNLRFARLNLVDLAGSERQKTSGAEGERLKEAANINKSLSTLGHVIMILLDVAHGKPRHVPYRDSRLTFLLQDSLGGNSKTMIIANVSPSICCAAETLNTLKFAQRAKLIQNNAVVNEDSTGDVIALQNQIRLLKEELSVLKRQNVSRSLSFGSTTIDTDNTYEMEKQQADNLLGYECKGIVGISAKQLKSLETMLAGALRREQMAESSIKKLEAEIKQLNCLVHQREEDTRSTKMMLRFREDKIQRMESLLGSSLPANTFLQEENRVLLEEIQLLQAKVDKNPEVTRFASENIRLSDQLRGFQEFYEEGEREMLLAEVSNLRDQLVQFLDGNFDQHNHPDLTVQPQEAICIRKENDSLQKELKNTIDELEECRRNLSSCLEDNAKLSREIHDLHSMLNSLKSAQPDQDDNVKTIKDSLGAQSDKLEGVHANQVMDYAEEIMDLQLESDILKIMLKEERSARGEIEDREMCLNSDLELSKDKLFLLNKQFEDAKSELKEANSVIEALESQQILSINEMENLRKSNSHYLKLLRKQELEIIALKGKLSSKELRDHSPEDHCDNEDSATQSKFKRMQDSLEKAKRLNMWFQSDLAFQASNEEEMDETRRQAEAETAEVIVCMQDELVLLQKEVQDCHLREMETKTEEVLLKAELKELQEKSYLMTEDNNQLLGKLEEKDAELRTLYEEWEMLTCEIEEVLANGHEALIDASDQVDLISSSFPHKRVWISEQVGRLTRIISEKELLIQEFGRCLEDANSKRRDLECMLKSLRGAALVFNEAHQQECNEKQKEIILLASQLNAKTSTISELEDKMKLAECHISKATVCATVAFVIVSRLSEVNVDHIDALKHKDIRLRESAEIIQTKDALLSSQAAAIKEAEKQMQCLRKEIAELEETCAELGKKLSEEQQRACAMEQKLEDIEENDILRTQEKLSELKNGVSTLRSCMSMYVEHDKSPEKSKIHVCMPVDVSGEGRSNAEINFDDVSLHLVEDPGNDISDCSLEEGSSLYGNCCHKHMEPRKSCKDVCDRDVTIILLKKEIESALESLRQVQVEMAKLRDEKEEIRMSEKQSKESLKGLTDQVLNLQAAMNNFEEQSQLKVEAANHKLQAFEQILLEAGIQWCQTKEFLELEIGDAKIIAAQKAAEATCILAKFEEAQDTMKEADIMINELVIANETMKLDLERLKQIEITLVNERDVLISQVQGLQSINDLKDRQFENLAKQFSSNLVETRDLVVELETIIIQLQATFNEKFMAIANDCSCMKSLILESTRSVRSCLEDIWPEIIVKDCAVSVLHLCHMGILLETVTGLNAENGLLQHGLCESNSVIADLREHNIKSRRELEMCRNLRGKLLVDIKNSFDRISRKEEETSELSTKLSTFEKKISDLQLQEELMLQRSSYMGSHLAILMKELDLSNTNFVVSLLDQEKLLKDKEEVLNSQIEFFMVDLCSKDIESLMLASKLEEMAFHLGVAETELFNHVAMLENLKKEFIFSKVDEELKYQYLMDCEVEAALLEEKENEAQSEIQLLLSRLNQSSMRVKQLEEVNKSLEQDSYLLKDVSSSNDMLKLEIGEVMETKVELLNQVQELQADCEKLLKDLKMKETELDLSAGRISILEQETQKWQKDISSLEISSCKLQNELEMKAVELSRMCCLEEETKSLKIEVQNLKTENSLVLHDLEEKKSNFESSLRRIDSSDIENRRLQEKVYSLESRIAILQTDVEMKNAELNGLQHSQSDIIEDLSLKIQDLKIYVNKVNALKDENSFLRNELHLLKDDKCEALNMSSLNIAKCVDSVKSVDTIVGRLFNILSEDGSMIVNKLFQLIFENVDRISKFTEEVECLECHVKELLSESMTLQGELLRKDDVLEGLLFDLRLLQESASSSKDQKDEIEEMVACLDALEDKLALKSSDLDEAVAHSQMLEVQLQEKIEMITTLELDILKERESLKFLSGENQELRAQVEDALAEKRSLEEEVKERRKITESLELEISEMGDALGQMNDTIDSLRNNLNELTCERDHLQEELLSLKERLEKAEGQAKEIEAIALEAQQLAESRRIYAEDREAEVKLLERSVEELECTVNVLENKVDIVKGEAERQRLQREELELEFHAVNQQMQNVKNTDADMRRHIYEKEKDLQEALNNIDLLERDIADKGAEIAQFKAHISELNLLAEAQASEYKQQFKALEVMAEQVRPEGHFSHVPNSSSSKSEKNAAKSRGSGSPFKCIGLGLGQQIKSENDEELAAARLRIEELESSAVSRQKEIYTLKARLATAESMTHDVIRDLLGVKLDMTNYVSLLDNQRVQKITEKAILDSSGSQVKEQEVITLKQQLNEFIEERQGWLEEIDRKQAEMVAAQIAVEKFRQHDQLLKTENDMLKMENVNHKKKVLELEGEVKKLSGQQNLQQRIHHHAKIKEENNMLKIQNEDLSVKLRRAEVILSRVKEELAHYRASIGKKPCINFDEEQRLSNKLKETENDKVQLAQKLLGLCTNVLKAAGVKKPASDINPAVAEEALEHLKNKVTSLEQELQNLKLKSRVGSERNRLSELLPQSSPISSKTDENCQTPRRVSQAPFFSALDR